MIVAGDEFGRTQRGNNNAYCQDNEISWVDWTQLDRRRPFVNFVRNLIKLRAGHAIFRQPQFFHGNHIDGDGVKDIAWLTADGNEVTEDEWRAGDKTSLGVRYAVPRTGRLAAYDGELDRCAFLLLMNAGGGEIAFRLPDARPSNRWIPMLDTASATLQPGSSFPQGLSFPVAAHSLVLLAGEG